MSSAETSRRLRHIGLISQQRRLRHLRSLSARNISREKSKWGTESLMETYFTLHSNRSTEAFYTSEKIQDSLNPTWRSFDLCRSCPEVNTSLSAFYVKVWGGHDSDFKLIIEWKVDLKGLSFIGTKIHKDGVKYQPNSIIFGMFDGFYSSADNLQESSRNKARFCKFLEVDQSSAVLTYNSYSLARLHTTQRAIKQTEVTVGKVRTSIIQKLSDTTNKTRLCSEKEAIELRLMLLKEEIINQRKRLEREKEVYDHHKQQLQSKVETTKLRWDELQHSHEELQMETKKMTETRDINIQVVSMYTARKASLVQELSHIYPICQLPSNMFTICKAPLPHAESNIQMNKDDMTISTALGHASHLILMISKLLQVPLRYQIHYNGSRSTIHDHITEPLQDKDRDFPLYTRGKEKFHFNYAVYLLNRNIAQLRYILGLGTSDLRLTLPNLQTLLELKWGTSVSLPPTSSGANTQPPGAASQPVPAGSPRSRASIGIQASGPYMSPNPPNYSSAASGVPAGLLAENIPNSPPPPYHISEATQQGRAEEASGSTPQGDAPQDGRGANGERRGGGLRDSGVVVTEGDEASPGDDGGADHSSGEVAGSEDSLNGRTSDGEHMTNGASSDGDDEDDEERQRVRAEVIGIGQLNYSSGDALSQDSVDLHTIQSAGSGATSPMKSNANMSLSDPQTDQPTDGEEQCKQVGGGSNQQSPSKSPSHNQSNSNNASPPLIPGQRAKNDSHSSLSTTKSRVEGHQTDPREANQVNEGSTGEVPFMAVDRIFHFDDISSRADALSNQGSFASFKPNNSISVSKAKSASES
ncbi:UV radiation resistance-associated gene protein-like [Lytechinus pictus]|uniref:UV radiation resistance-associated gene protein-like n=1 Tax=Lytechinus pictus TaxID=7653 RepID=UPI0030B9C482